MSRKKLLKLFTLLLVLVLAGAFITACNGDDEGVGEDDLGVGDEEGVFEEEGLEGEGVFEDEGLGEEGVLEEDANMFTTYDADQDAFIDTGEFETFLGDNDMGFTEEDTGLFEQYDENADAVLDENEVNALTES